MDIEILKLTNKELSEKCHALIDDFCKNGKQAKLWYMSIPARPNHDADLLMSQLLHRFETQQSEIDQLKSDRLEMAEGLYDSAQQIIKGIK